MQTGQMPELVRRKGEMKVDGGVLPGNGAIICIIAKLCVFLGTQLQKIHSFKDILSCKLTLADLRQAHNWSTESEKILSRLEALSQLDTLMDEFLLLYGFSGEKLAAQTPPLRTKIDADYLIKYQLPSGITFFFSVKQKDGYCGRSLFINNELDYSRGQTKFTLLEKTKTNLRTGEQILLYRRSTYQK